MANHLLATKHIESSLEEFVLQKTEGNPFFIEEFIKSLKDLQIIVKKDDTYCIAKDIQTVAIPSSIQDVIMARVDTLPEEAKDILQIGSVIGREFNYDLIWRVTNLLEENLLSHLSLLKDLELLYERGIYPQSTYIFKHALTQEVAYNSLLSKRKKEVHGLVGQAIEEIYPKRVEEFCEILSFHFLRGENWQRAYTYSREAGLKGLGLSNYEEAQRYFETALSALEKLSRSRNRIEQEIDLRFSMRSALFPLGRHDDWAEYTRAAEVLAKEIEDVVRLAKVYSHLSTYQWMHGRHREAIGLCEEGLRLAESAGDFSAQISTIFHLGVPLLWVGKYERQVNLHREVAQRLSGPSAFERHGLAGVPSVMARGCLAWGLAELGEFEEAEDWGQEAIEIAEQVKNAFSTTFNYTCLALAYLRSGKLDPAIELLQKAQNLIRDANVQSVLSFSAMVLGQVHLLKGHPDQALLILEEAVRSENLYGTVIPKGHPMAGLAEAYLLNGQIERAVEKAEEALSTSRKTGELGFRAWSLYVMAKIQSDYGTEQLSRAVDSYHQAIDQAAELGMRPLLAHCHLGLGKLFIEDRRIQEAQHEIKTAIDLYHSMNMSFWLPKAEAALSQI